jgi:hypothetical protein
MITPVAAEVKKDDTYITDPQRRDGHRVRRHFESTTDQGSTTRRFKYNRELVL